MCVTSPNHRQYLYTNRQRKEKKSANPELCASAAPFVFRAAAASFTPSFVQSKSSVNSATLESSAFAPPSLPAAQPEAAASIQHTADTPPPGMTNSPSKITLTFERAAAIFAAGAPPFESTQNCAVILSLRVF